MMQNNLFVGRLSADPESAGETVTRFTLIANEFAGKDEAGNTKERKVAIPFVAFGNDAKFILNYGKKGEKVLVNYRIENNVFSRNGKQGGEKVYGYNFIVKEIELA